MEVSGRRDGRSFKDSVGKSSAEIDEVFCQPCSSEGDWVVAMGYCQNCHEYFCAACLKPHRKQSVTRHHAILEGKHMPRSQMSHIQLDLCSEPCGQHTNEILKFYCSSHDTVGCSDCMVLDHKACKVDRIQDISSNYFNSQKHRELVGQVDSLLNDLDKLKHQIQRNEQYIKDTCNKAVSDIKAFRNEVNNYLDKVEAEILTEVNRRKHTDENVMASLEANKQSLQNEIEELEQKLNQQSNKANEVFVVAVKMKKRMSSFDATLQQMFKNSQVKQYRFQPSAEVSHIMSSHVSLGKLTENLDENRSQKEDMVPQSDPLRKQTGHSDQDRSRQTMTESSDHSRKQKKIEELIPQFESEINVRAQEEKLYCFIIASVVISPTQIVLVDYKNKSLKLVDIEQRKLLARYGFSTYQTDVARVSENTVAVTLPDEQTIQFLSITQDNKFTPKQEMKVNCDCRKLFCEKDQIIIACEGKIQILDTSGKVVKEITFPDLTQPKCIAATRDSESFFVSNSVLSGKPTAIYKFNYDGSLVATYTDKNLPYVTGLTVTRDGTVLVCNWSDPGSIHVMSPECKKIKEILQHNEHVRRPYCVSYCEETNKLFICNYLGWRSENKLTDVLKVFQMH